MRIATPNGPMTAGKTAVEEVVKTFRRWLYVPDDGHIKTMLGAYAANCIAGDPVWLMLVGGSGIGKTEAIRTLSKLPRIVEHSQFASEASLLSGTKAKDRAEGATGGLLREIGEFGVLALKDFTSTLSMKHEHRDQLLSGLREAYDGSWTRRLGVDGGRTLTWIGKMGLITGCTSVIDSHHAVMAAMGERFILYRIHPLNNKKLGELRRKHLGKEENMRWELAEAVSDLFIRCEKNTGLTATGKCSLDDSFELSDEQYNAITDLSALAATSRSAVQRDGYKREVVNILDRESPARIMGGLIRLVRGMLLIGVEEVEALQLAAKVAMDSIPQLRRRVLVYLSEFEEPQATQDVADAVGYPTGTARRALEDLAAHDVVVRFSMGQGKPQNWDLTDWAKAIFQARSTLLSRKLPLWGDGVNKDHTGGEFSGKVGESGEGEFSGKVGENSQNGRCRDTGGATRVSRPSPFGPDEEGDGSGERQNVCWNCKTPVNSSSDSICSDCNWIICPACNRCEKDCVGYGFRSLEKEARSS